MSNFTAAYSDTTNPLFPLINCKLATSCTSTCDGNTNCLLYGESSISSTFIIQNSDSSFSNGYSVIFANSATSAVNTCSNAYDCYIFCQSGSCTNTLKKNYPGTTSSYEIIDCTSATSCSNTCLNQLQCLINCNSATSCTNSIKTTTSFLATITNNIYYAQINCKASSTCDNTCENTNGCYVDCSSHTTSCSLTLKNSPVSYS